MGKLNHMLEVYEKMDNMEKQLVYKLLAILIMVIMGFSVFGIVHFNTCIL